VRQSLPLRAGPIDDNVFGFHFDDAIEPWLAERGFCNRHSDESLILESA